MPEVTSAGVGLLTTHEVAERLGVSRRLIQKKIKAGEIAAVRITPVLLRVSAAELERFIHAKSEGVPHVG